MQRYLIELSYNGAVFNGWQRQPNAPSVQQCIEECLSKVHSHREISVVGCGRTDTGVHANHYVMHVHLPKVDDFDHFLFKMNKVLPEQIAFHSIQSVTDHFHARFDAKLRTYRYFIHRTKNPFRSTQSWYVPKKLDVAAMNEAATFLLGKQDFTSLSKLHTDVKTNICEVSVARWVEMDQDALYFEIAADRFLRNMVRATVGTLVDVGLGKIPPSEIPTILAAKDRQAASVSVPAQGLFLWEVKY